MASQNLSQLTPATTSSNGDLYYLVQGGNDRSITFTALQAALSAGQTTVSSLNSLTGALNILAGSGITVTPNGSGITISSSGTVASVGLSVPATSIFGVTGSPVTTSGTLGLTTTGTIGGLPYFSTTSALSNLPIGTTDQILTVVGGLPTWVTPSIPGSGTVTSVAFSDASTSPIYAITGSPITTSGTLTQTLITQAANLVFASAVSGGSAQPTFRSLVVADIPLLNQNTSGTASNITATTNSTITTLNALQLPTTQLTGDVVLTTQVSGVLPVANGGTGDTSFVANQVIIGGTTTTSPLAQVAGGTVGQILTAVSSTAAPVWANVSPSSSSAITNTSTNASFYPTLVSSSSTGNQSLDVSSGLSFNPSTNTLAAGNASITSALTAATMAVGGATIGSSALAVKSTSDGVATNTVLISANGSTTWYMGVENSGGFFLYNGGFLALNATGDTVGIGPQGPNWRFTVNSPDNNTTTTAPVATGGIIVAQTAGTTVGNFSTFGFGNQSDVLNSYIIGVNEVQGASPTGHMSFFVANAGTYLEAQRLKSNGLLQLPQYTTSGVLINDSSGNVTSVTGGTVGQVLTAVSPTAAPTWQTPASAAVNRVPIRTTVGNVVLTTADYYIILTDTNSANYNVTFPAGVNGLSFVIGTTAAASVGNTSYTFVPNGSDTFDTPITTNNLGAAYPNTTVETFYNGVWYQTQ